MEIKQLDLFPTLKPLRKSDLSEKYGYSERTIRRMCHDIGIVSRRHLLNVMEIEWFYKNYGLPEKAFNDCK